MSAVDVQGSNSRGPSQPLEPDDRGVILLSGGNPQIPKGAGDAPVAAYVDAVPGWKQAIVRDLDTLIVEVIPGVKKAVKWNTPLYGLDGETWIVSLHCFDKFVRVTFFKGTELDPMPLTPSKVKGVRYHDVTETAGIEREQVTSWLRQAAVLPGKKM